MTSIVTFDHTKARHCVLKHNISLTEFAGVCGINRSHLWLVMHGKQNPSAKLRRRLLMGLSQVAGRDYQFDDFFEVSECGPGDS